MRKLLVCLAICFTFSGQVFCAEITSETLESVGSGLKFLGNLPPAPNTPTFWYQGQTIGVPAGLSFPNQVKRACNILGLDFDDVTVWQKKSSKKKGKQNNREAFVADYLEDQGYSESLRISIIDRGFGVIADRVTSAGLLNCSISDVTLKAVEQNQLNKYNDMRVIENDGRAAAIIQYPDELKNSTK